MQREISGLLNGMPVSDPFLKRNLLAGEAACVRYKGLAIVRHSHGPVTSRSGDPG